MTLIVILSSEHRERRGIPGLSAKLKNVILRQRLRMTVKIQRVGCLSASETQQED